MPPAPAEQRFVQLPTDIKRSSATPFEPACSASLRYSLGRPAQREELIGALAALLHRYTGQTAIAIDLYTADSPEALEIALKGEASIASVFEAARLALMEPVPVLAGRGSNIAATVVTDPEIALSVSGRHDAHFILVATEDGAALTLAYDAGLLRPTSAAQLMESYGVLLTGAIEDGRAIVQSLPLLSQQTSYALSVWQDGGTSSYPALPAHALFSALAKTQGQATALSYRDQSLTYAELDERSNRLAHHLIDQGVGPEVAVAVCVRPSFDIMVAMLAIWKARGVYLPLDPTHPEALIGRMLDEARPRLVLTVTELAGLTGGWPQFRFDRDNAMTRERPRTAPVQEVDLSDTAYLLYTSGTTGKSKGVAASQANLVHYVHSAAQKYGFTARDHFVSLARYTFSISLFELLSPLCCGGSLKLIDREDLLSPDRLSRALGDVTVLHAGPALLTGLFRHLRNQPAAQRCFPKMRHASSGGDIVTPAVMEEMKDVFPHAELFVTYGCSEISCMGTTYPIERDGVQSRTMVGKPFPNVTLRVLDSQGNPVPFGVVGEICFAGEGIVKGYLDQPELTAEKFIERDGRRFYHTGDMGRLHSDGHLEILGRRDFQVQMRGIRVELAGIETVVQQLGLAAQCAVVARRQGNDGGAGDMRLVAFVVKPRNDRIATFRRALAKELPDYMLPHQVVVLEAMPLTVNGKLDRTRLAEMPIAAPVQTSLAGPLSDRERTIADIFARTLGLRDVGPDDSFFDLGGDSLLGMVALMEIEKVLGLALPPSVLFERGTVRALANHQADEGETRLPKPVLLNSKVGGAPLFLLSGVHVYRELAKRLDGFSTCYGVFTRQEIEAFDPDTGVQTVESLARDYIRIIRAQQPAGPYRILGYSFSGVIAYEVAQQLRVAGEVVEFLALVDSHLPEWTAGWKHRLVMLTRLPAAPWRESAGFLWRKLLAAVRAEPDEAQVYHDDSELAGWEVQRGIANFTTIAQYRPRIRPSDMEVLLLVSGTRLKDNPLHSPTCGWSPFIGRLEIHRIEADHFQMMRDDPHIGQAAGIIANRLSEL